jgi:catechol 2,3-dioxygenase-like lactoylglutathione lyase family enzyme
MEYNGAMTVQLTKDSIDLGIVVKDIDAALAFYRDTLGFKPVGDDSMPGGAHMWRLMCGTSMIKLVTFERTPQGGPPPGAIGKGFGYRYWTISISNLADVVAACEAGGYKVAVPITTIRPGVDIAIVEDADGNWVEFLAAS